MKIMKLQQSKKGKEKMRYWKIFMSNGFGGCDEEFLTTTEGDYELEFEEVLDMYSYESGAAGVDTADPEEFDEEYTYTDRICEYSTWDEIDEEEFIQLRDEEDWEVR